MINEKLKVAEGSLNEAKEYVKEGNPVQAGEKIYKIVEERIRILAEKNKLPEYEETKKKVDGGPIYLVGQLAIFQLN